MQTPYQLMNGYRIPEKVFSESPFDYNLVLCQDRNLNSFGISILTEHLSILRIHQKDLGFHTTPQYDSFVRADKDRLPSSYPEFLVL